MYIRRGLGVVELHTSQNRVVDVRRPQAITPGDHQLLPVGGDTSPETRARHRSDVFPDVMTGVVTFHTGQDSVNREFVKFQVTLENIKRHSTD